jgi:hypothetical protein
VRRLRRVLVPVRFALRRVGARPLSLAGLALALAGAAALIGWSSISAALAHEENVRLRLQEAALQDRSFHVAYTIEALGSDWAADPVAASLDRLGPVIGPAAHVRIWHSRGATSGGVRFVAAEDIVVSAGRAPSAGCPRGVCETLALAGDYQVGQLVRIDEEMSVRVVGTGSLPAAALPNPEELGRRALLIGPLSDRLEDHLQKRGSTVLVTAPLDAEAVRGTALRPLHERLRLETVSLERADPRLDADAPLALLDELADRGDVARTWVLIVGGQGAALIIAFAAFAASARRRDMAALDEQLSILGATRTQVWTARFLEAALPALAGGLAAFGALLLLAWRVAETNELSSYFVAAALPVEAVGVIAAVVVGAGLVLLTATAPSRRARFGIGALELTAVTALAFVVWQTTVTGGLDADRIEAGEGAGPLLLLLPALASFVTAVVLLRALPLVLRLGERLARAAPFGVRLAFLTAGRARAQAAAATTFLAVTLGAALFGLNYAATLERQARDEAAFAAGAAWRVLERPEGNVPGVALGRGSSAPGDVAPSLGPVRGTAPEAFLDVTPLTRFRRATRERPTPVLRLETRLSETGATGGEVELELVGLPPRRLPDVLGWRDSFSAIEREELSRRLRPRPVRLKGPRLVPESDALRMWGRGDTVFPRIAVLHFLLPEEQRFRPVRLGPLIPEWRRLSLEIPPSLRGAELVAIEFPPTYQPFGSIQDGGFIELGGLELRRGGSWVTAATLESWAASSFGGAVYEPDLTGAPVDHGIRYEVQGAPLSLIRPESPVPGAVPGLVSPSVASAAAGGTITLELLGKEISVRVAATAELFPTAVARPSNFVVLDYDALFAALNVDQPGLAVPSEAWFFAPQAPGFGDRLERPPFRLERAVEAEALEARLLNDPLAAGARDVLRLSAFAAMLLGVLGLVLATRIGLASERTLFAEYEALGVAPRTLVRSTQVRIAVLSALGVLAGLAGGLAAARLLSALVAVTGTGGRPLPPVEPVISWLENLVVLAIAAVVGLGAAALLASWVLRESAARRLRA